MIKKIKIPTFLIKSKFNKHKKYKNILLNCFKNIKVNKDNFNKDNIFKLDFNDCNNPNREWTKLLIPDLLLHFSNCIKHIGYEGLTLRNIWFQQYNKEGYHGWHIHGSNYTGVYYVSFNKNFAKTKIIDPTNYKKIYEINAKEGDIILFPAFLIHESSIQKTNELKTIISFNLDFNNFQKKIILNIKNAKTKKI